MMGFAVKRQSEGKLRQARRLPYDASASFFK